MTVGRLARSWAWVAASVAAAWLGSSSVSRAQPAPHPKAQMAPAAHPAGSSTAAPPAASSDGVVNLNEANADELERLPGIGPAKARAIVEHRHGHPFHRVDEITKVKGIGRKTFAKLRPYLTLVGATTLAAQPSSR